jgi:hypothetical protein
VRAAQEAGKVWLKEHGSRAEATPFAAITQEVLGISGLDQVSQTCSKLAAVPLPIGVFGEYTSGSFRDMTVPPHAEPQRAKLSVAFLEFLINGTPVQEIHHLPPNILHDIDIEVRVSDWPAEAERLVLKPISVEPASTYEMPEFEFARPVGPPPFSLRRNGRGQLKVPQHISARPLEFRYLAEFLPTSVSQPIDVMGQRTMRLEGIDWRKYPQTGYPSVDAKLLEVRNQLRATPGITDTDLQDALKILVQLGKLAGQAVQDALFDGEISEAEFQRFVRQFLRGDPSIGAELEEQARVAGGLTDLSFRGIRIELKSESRRELLLVDCQNYTGQAASYAAGTGKHIGILCVLDCTKKARAPFPPDSGMGVLSVQGNGAAVQIVTVLVQGNFSRPSDLSKKSKVRKRGRS